MIGYVLIWQIKKAALHGETPLKRYRLLLYGICELLRY